MDWLKHNKDVLNIKAIAEKVPMPVRTLSGFVHDQKDAKGYLFKLPAKYQEALKKVIKSIRKP